MPNIEDNQNESEAGTSNMKPGCSASSIDASTPHLQGPMPAPSDFSPTSGETVGLLSLPCEVLSQIASYLPAEFVIYELPKVSPFFSMLLKDTTAWQLRAQRLCGTRACFTALSKKSIDWPAVCLEMERLVSHWTERAEYSEKVEHKEGGPVIIPEMVLDIKLRQELQEGLRNPENLASGKDADSRSEQPTRSSSPPPILERISLPSAHIAQIDSVLLLGGEGSVCATASRDWNVKLWNLQEGSNGTLLFNLAMEGATNTHSGWVWCLASEGPMLASGGFDSTVNLWDMNADGAHIRQIKMAAPVLCLSCQTDVILAGTFDQKICMFDTRAANPLIRSFHFHRNHVMCLAAFDNYLISGSKDRTIVVYDRRADKGLEKIRLNSYPTCMSYSGWEVWAGDVKGNVHSLFLKDGKLERRHFNVDHTSVINGIHSSHGSLYTCSSDRTLKVHIPSTPPRTLCTLKYQAGVHSVCEQAGVVVVSSGDLGVEVWRPRR